MFHTPLICTFCRKANPYDPCDYTGHTLRNEKGEVVCPKLLNNICNFCNQKGHTGSYCPLNRRTQVSNLDGMMAKMSAMTLNHNYTQRFMQPRIEKHPAAYANDLIVEYIMTHPNVDEDELIKGMNEEAAEKYLPVLRSFMMRKYGNVCCMHCKTSMPQNSCCYTHSTETCFFSTKCNKCGGYGHSERWCNKEFIATGGDDVIVDFDDDVVMQD